MIKSFVFDHEDLFSFSLYVAKIAEDIYTLIMCLQITLAPVRDRLAHGMRDLLCGIMRRELGGKFRKVRLFHFNL